MTKGQLNRQLQGAIAAGLAPMLADSANRHALPFSFVLAVASRETGIRNIAGDGGHGRGVMQIDDRYHAIARDTNFLRDPEALIDYGCKMLKENRKWAAEMWPTYTSQQHLKIAASAYNAGRAGARSGVRRGNCDLNTTGHDYGKDVIARAILFDLLLPPDTVKMPS